MLEKEDGRGDFDLLLQSRACSIVIHVVDVELLSRRALLPPRGARDGMPQAEVIKSW